MINRLLSATLLTLLLAVGLQGQTCSDAGDLTKLLNDFLAGASKDDVAMHDRFWADDLIYTGSVGRRVGKADILNELRKPKTVVAEPPTLYTAEEVRIQQYGDTAIVAFRLVGTVERNKKIEVSKYLNTGTFLKRNGKWQAVAWQATRLPRPEQSAKQELAAADADFRQALVASNVETLQQITDEGFVWTNNDGQQMSRGQLIDKLKSGNLKFLNSEPGEATVSLFGETAVSRGVLFRQPSAVLVEHNRIDLRPWKEFYSLTFVNRGGPWKAVSMHSSR